MKKTIVLEGVILVLLFVVLILMLINLSSKINDEFEGCARKVESGEYQTITNCLLIEEGE